MNPARGFPFTLPRGYTDEHGTVHRNGSMRLATAMDEILPLKESRVQTNPAYLAVILLSRVVTTLGELAQVSTRVIEDLPVADFAYLQAMYQRINEQGDNRLTVHCPECACRFEVEAQPSGEV